MSNNKFSSSMSSNKCPLCGQVLPVSLTAEEIRSRLQNLAAPLVTEEKSRIRNELEEHYREQLTQQEKAIEARTLERASAEGRREAAKFRKEAQREVEASRRREQAKSTELKAKLAKERARNELENARLRSRVEELSRRLERVETEQMGEEAELDLYSRLQREFPSDKLERVGKGVRGADIIQHVIAGKQEVGRIVYESKNVSSWQNAFVSRAKQYQRQYETPYAVVVTRALPKKQQGFCVVRKIPVIEPSRVLKKPT